MDTPTKTPEPLILTALQSCSKPPRKTVFLAADGTVKTRSNYPKIKFWLRQPVSLAPDIDALGEYLGALAADQTRCLVTGSPTDWPLDWPALRRKVDGGPGNAKATLMEGAAAWLPVDVDHVALPGRLDPLDVEPAISHVVALLGAPFSDCSYVWTLTASAEPLGERVSCRLFFLTDQPISNDQRKRWAKAVNERQGIRLVDPALYSAAQPIYTASPEFVGGPDPFPLRTGVVYGEIEVLPWATIEAHTQEPPRTGGATGPSTYQTGVSRSIQGWLERIGDDEGQNGCHEPVRQAILEMTRAGWLESRIIESIQTAVAGAYWDRLKHPRQYIEHETSDAELGRSIAGAKNLVKAQRNQPQRGIQTTPPAACLSLAEAESQLKAALQQWDSGRRHMVIRGTLGLGKTRAATELLLANLDKRYLWACPTHEQGQEVIERLNATPFVGIDSIGFEIPNARKIEGRLCGGEDALCQRRGLVKSIQAAKLAPHTFGIACQSPAGECEHFRTCGYIRQFGQSERVRLIPHVYLKHPNCKAVTGFGDHDGLVIDESPLDALTGHTSRLLTDITRPALAAVLAMLKDGSDIADPQHWLTQLAAERADIPFCRPVNGPGPADAWALQQEMNSLIEANRDSNLFGLYDAVTAQLESGQKRNDLWFSFDGLSVHWAWRNSLEGLGKVLILDATADREVYAALLGEDFDFIEIEAEQRLNIVQISDSPLGKGKLLDDDTPHLLQVATLARMLNAALISNKDAIDKAKERGWLGRDHVTGHFNALRGCNLFEQENTLIIAGRPEPPPLAVEALARALWPGAELNLNHGYQWQQDGGAVVAAHPDARCDRLLRMVREAEIDQAIGRLRAIRAEKPKTVILLTHTPIRLPVQHRRLAELLPDPDLCRVLQHGGGVALMGAGWLAQHFPDRWQTEKAAARWLEKFQTPQPLIENLLKGMGGLKTLHYRRLTQRGGRLQYALTWLAIPAAHDHIERLCGEAVMIRHDTPEPIAPEAVQPDCSPTLPTDHLPADVLQLLRVRSRYHPDPGPTLARWISDFRSLPEPDFPFWRDWLQDSPENPASAII